ncbi:hypothetical protein Pla8534_35710 [Lignipirellula cremea]|uniref:Uncharacterized protein n=1 Tax=Lignipirellula cremea TaxID=2528010 RepID=A0A518DVA3_9BACT|nr:hypothetical protein Pla8534_35710 [Lignipirellula cremea]
MIVRREPFPWACQPVTRRVRTPRQIVRTVYVPVAVPICAMGDIGHDPGDFSDDSLSADDWNPVETIEPRNAISV